MVVAYDEACLRGHGVPQLIDILIRDVLHAQPTSPASVVEALLRSLTRKSTLSEYYCIVEKRYSRLMDVVDSNPHFGMFQGNEVFYFGRPRSDGTVAEMFPGGSEVRVTPSTYSHFIALRNHLESTQDPSNVTSHRNSSLPTDPFRSLPPLELLPLSPRLHLLSGTYAPILRLLETIVSLASMCPKGPAASSTAGKLERAWEGFNLVYAIPFHSVQHELVPNGSSTKVPYAEASRFIHLANNKLSDLEFESKRGAIYPTPPSASGPKSPVPTPPPGNTNSSRFPSSRRRPSDANLALQRSSSARMRSVGITSPNAGALASPQDGDLPPTIIAGTPIGKYSTDTPSWNPNHAALNIHSIPEEYLRLVKGFMDDSLNLYEFLAVGVSYCIPLGNGAKYNLIPNGCNIKVPFSERREYVRRVYVEKRRLDAEVIRDLIKHGAVTVASSQSPPEGSLRGSALRSPTSTSSNVNVRGSNSLSFSQGGVRVINPVFSKSPSFIQGNHFGHSRSISTIPLSDVQIESLKGFLSHLEALRGMTSLTQSQWDSFHIAYCIKLSGGVSFDLLPDGRKVPVELADKETFIRLAEDKAMTILQDQEERKRLEMKAATSPRRLLYHSSEGSPVSPSSRAESEKDRELFSPRDIITLEDDDNDTPVPIDNTLAPPFKEAAGDEPIEVDASVDVFSRGTSEGKANAGGMSSSTRQSLSTKRSSSSIPAAAAKAFAASKAAEKSSRNSSMMVQPGSAAWILHQSLSASGVRVGATGGEHQDGVLDGSDNSNQTGTAPTRRPTSSLDTNELLHTREFTAEPPNSGRETAVPLSPQEPLLGSAFKE